MTIPQMRVPLKLQIFCRNIKGHVDLTIFLCKWDRHCRKEMIVSILAGMLLIYSLSTWSSAYDLIIISMEVILLRIQLGWPMSILPTDYRPSYDHMRYSAETNTHIVHNELSFPMSHVYPVQEEAILGFHNPIVGWGLCRESPLVSDSVNDALMLRKSLPYREEDNNDSYIYSRHQLRYIAVRVAHKIQNTQNLLKLEFYDTAAALMGYAPVTVRKSYYFNALMTAEAFRSSIYRNNLRGEKEIYTDLTAYFPVKQEKTGEQQNVRFTPDFYKRVSGRIGVTTLLLTENRRVAMLLQGPSKPVGGEQVNLGGSGSVNYDDIAGAASPDDLRDVISYAMARELCEETGMQAWFGQAHINTMITGFFRWIDRCGHPEFIGITHVKNIPFSQQNKIDGDEVVKYEEVPITVYTPKDFCKVLDYIREHKVNVALSSLMALHRLTVIAGYDAEEATATQQKVHHALSRGRAPRSSRYWRAAATPRSAYSKNGVSSSSHPLARSTATRTPPATEVGSGETVPHALT